VLVCVRIQYAMDLLAHQWGEAKLQDLGQSAVKFTETLKGTISAAHETAIELHNRQQEQLDTVAAALALAPLQQQQPVVITKGSSSSIRSSSVVVQSSIAQVQSVEVDEAVGDTPSVVNSTATTAVGTATAAGSVTSCDLRSVTEGTRTSTSTVQVGTARYTKLTVTLLISQAHSSLHICAYIASVC
jgi:hypothetical protein